MFLKISPLNDNIFIHYINNSGSMRVENIPISRWWKDVWTPRYIDYAPYMSAFIRNWLFFFFKKLFIRFDCNFWFLKPLYIGYTQHPIKLLHVSVSYVFEEHSSARFDGHTFDKQMVSPPDERWYDFWS